MGTGKGGQGVKALLGGAAFVKLGLLAAKGLAVGHGVGVTDDVARMLRHTGNQIPSVTRAARPMDDIFVGLADDAALAYGDDTLRATDTLRPPAPRFATATDANRIRKLGKEGVPFADLPAIDRMAVQLSRPARFRHYAAVPNDTGEFAAIFGADAPVNGLRGAHQTRVRMEALQRVTLASHSDEAEDLFRFVDEADGDFVTFVGHNEHGQFRLPSGQSVDMAELSAHCAEVGTACVFLSCSSSRVVDGSLGAVGTQGALTYDDAMAAMRALDRMLEREALDQMSLHAAAEILSATLSRSLSRSRYRARVRYVGKRIGTGTGIGGVSIGISEVTHETNDKKGNSK